MVAKLNLIEVVLIAKVSHEHLFRKDKVKVVCNFNRNQKLQQQNIWQILNVSFPC